MPIGIFLILFAVLCQQSCRKTEINYDDLTVNVKSFLENKSPDNFELQLVITDFKSQLEKWDFTKYFLSVNGQPLWDNSYTVRNGKGDFEMFVPLKENNEKEVTSFFIISGYNSKIRGYEMHRKVNLLQKRKEKSQFSMSFSEINNLYKFLDYKVYHENNIKTSNRNTQEANLDGPCHWVASVNSSGNATGTFHLEWDDCPGNTHGIEFVFVGTDYIPAPTYGGPIGNGSSGGGSAGGGAGPGGSGSSGSGGTSTGGSSGGPFDPFGWNNTGSGGLPDPNDPCAGVPWYELCGGGPTIETPTIADQLDAFLNLGDTYYFEPFLDPNTSLQFNSVQEFQNYINFFKWLSAIWNS